jgi:hypothetical protein
MMNGYGKMLEEYRGIKIEVKQRKYGPSNKRSITETTEYVTFI